MASTNGTLSAGGPATAVTFTSFRNSITIENLDDPSAVDSVIYVRCDGIDAVVDADDTTAVAAGGIVDIGGQQGTIWYQGLLTGPNDPIPNSLVPNPGSSVSLISDSAVPYSVSA
jgi:hypothetical protein